MQCDFFERRFKTTGEMRIHRDSFPYNYGTADEVFEVEEAVFEKAVDDTDAH